MPLDWKTFRKKLLREHEQIRRKILNSAPRIKGDLERLSRSEAEQAEILDSLAFFVSTSKLPWRSAVRQQQKHLSSLAEQLDTLASHTERIEHDPFTRSQFWILLLGDDKWNAIDNRATVAPPRTLPEQMRDHAKCARREAQSLGKVLRQGATYRRRKAMAALLNTVSRISRKSCDDVLARLLTDAHEAVGTAKEFSADQIKKRRQRHTLRMRPRAQRTLNLLYSPRRDNSPPPN